jgi:hypothetical protein
MAMSKKDYVAIAAIIKRVAPSPLVPATPSSKGRKIAADEIAKGIADYAQSQNEQFDAVRFFAACGI